jgi:hypothetical protein
MKTKYLCISLAALLALAACKRELTPTETVKDKINDALDRRPAEGLRDAAEDIGDSIKDADRETSKTIEEIAR